MPSGEPGYAGRHVLVAGAGIAGTASARALLALDARVTVVDRVDSPALAALASHGARTVVADVPDTALLATVDEVVVSPGFAPNHPLVRAAADAGREVYSEPELAWRVRQPARNGRPAPWLAVTGTNGKTTTVTMLASVLGAAGYRTAALGNIGEPLVHAVLRKPGDQYDVIAVELSSQQLHWSSRLAPEASALLNIADDHLDWHGGVDGYVAAKADVWRAARTTPDGVAVGNLDDPRVASLLAEVSGRRIGFRLGPPGPGEMGLSDDTLTDRASGPDPIPLLAAGDLPVPGRHNVANALAAAALARAYGVTPEAVRDGLAGFEPPPHRNAVVGTVAGVTYVDDSKATNPHAASGSLNSYPRIVWVAGGQLKGVDVDGLVADVADRLVGAVLIGVDRARIAEALRRHAPEVPVVSVARTDDGAMTEAVTSAAALATAGDTVLLAPAAASYDMYANYAERGRRFAAAVADLPAARR